MLRQPLFLLSLASFVAQLSCLLSPCFFVLQLLSSPATPLPPLPRSAPPPPPLPPRLPLSDPLQTCLFGATIYLGAYCCSHQVIGAVARTSTWDMGGRKCVCVCLSVGACRAKGRQKKTEGSCKNNKKKRKRERRRGTEVMTHTGNMNIYACQDCDGCANVLFTQNAALRRGMLSGKRLGVLHNSPLLEMFLEEQNHSSKKANKHIFNNHH